MTPLTTFPVFNGYAPSDGPKAVPVNVDFTTVASQPFDMVELYQTGELAGVQSVWIDNSDVGKDLTITIGGTGQRIIAPANTQGIYPVLAVMPLRFTVAISATEAHTAHLIFMNVPMPQGNWGP